MRKLQRWTTRVIAAIAAMAGSPDIAPSRASDAVTPSGYPGRAWQPGPAQYGARIVEDMQVTMEDGVRLRASVAYPTDPATGERATGRFPVLVEFTPYLRLGAPVVPNTYFTDHGYIYVIVRPRGTGGSDGEMQQFSSRDGRDGATVVAWAARDLNGSDGRIGLVGCSYPGGTALATAAAVGPNSPVRAVVATCIGLDMQHRQVWTTNGLPNAALSSYAPRAGALMGDQPSVTGYFQKFYEGVMAGGPEAYDGYWKDRLPLDWAKPIADSGIPVLLWSGWSDINEIGAIHAYTALQNAAHGLPVAAPMAADMPVSPRYQIIMGDWGHAQGLDASIYLQWFETWLKGVNTGMETSSTPMHLFEKGTARWTNLTRYPASQNYTRAYLQPHGGLGATPPAEKGDAGLVWGSPDAESGKLVFETQPYAEGATLAGPISATIHASSSNTNLELIANLYDVAPDGAATRISMGAVLGSQSALDETRSWKDGAGVMVWPWPKLERDDDLTPDSVTRFDVFLASRQWGVRSGHRLRLELTTQSPASVCPAEGQVPMISEPCRLTAPQARTLPGGRYRILFGADTPSALNLPALPPNVFPAVASATAPTAWNETMRRLEPGKTTLPLEW
jgi:predicted acyl esterase